MASPCVIGTETEFGITVRNQPDFNPTLASSIVVNSYDGGRVRVRWSFDEESPGRDARQGVPERTTPGPDSGLVNVVLSNGARFYVDHAHPEYSSPECATPWQAALYDKVGERVVANAVLQAHNLLAPRERLYIHKNNSDGKGNSYGHHENYLVDRKLPFSDLVRYATTWLVTRQIFTGSGKVGAENGRPRADYQISQRADFFEEEVGLETTLKRPIINTRDEPHGDPRQYRRFHVIIGDANMSEVQTFVKLGTTALLLNAIEDGALPHDLALADPVAANWQLSRDLTLQRPVLLADGSTATPIEIQFRYLEWLSDYSSSCADGEEWALVITEWQSILEDLDRDPGFTSDRLDWTAKLRTLAAIRQREDLPWNHPKLALAALQYHDTDATRGIAHRLAKRGLLRRLFTDGDLAAATVDPPTGTRAYFRGRCVKQYASSLVAANWDSLVFDIGEEALKRVPMMEPLRGTHGLVGELLDGAPDAASLLDALGA